MKKRISGWSRRLLLEGERASSALFVTLTYNTGHVPFTNAGYMTLCKPDLQKFFKRLRWISPEHKIKYYACGEYGGKRMRPHYHIILFNTDYATVTKAWALDEKPLGNIDFGDVTGASIGYTLKYMSKPSVIPKHKNDDRIKEFSLMSKDLAATTSVKK